MSKYRSTGMLLNHIATLPLRGFVDVKDAEEAEAFFKANPLPEVRTFVFVVVRSSSVLSALLQVLFSSYSHVPV